VIDEWDAVAQLLRERREVREIGAGLGSVYMRLIMAAQRSRDAAFVHLEKAPGPAPASNYQSMQPICGLNSN
jgi:hypothetical protein